MKKFALLVSSALLAACESLSPSAPSATNLDGELAEGAAKRVLPAEIRLSIRQVALHRGEDAAERDTDAQA
ncbi:hypothetical protein HU762_07635 [Pseudomonas sp. SWRI92]|uniref:hypothetical protein n=1 Tax=Pseudomonas sp. SWRI92 TaxID=2745499 RepID=UPI001648C912|nr:hypothetical protein [Pseudomonas sp. SWRI92]MBC3373813.1 hypothetical protein [Pseudomonas sp. SWRI92]